MHRIIGPFLVFLLVLPFGAAAQEKTPQMTYLDQMVGTFEYDHTDGRGECRKMGDFIVHCRSAWTNSSGEGAESVWITRLEPETGNMTAYRFYSHGYTDSGPVWINGEEAVTVYEGPGGLRQRITHSWSGNTLNFVWHESVRGGPWKHDSEGSATWIR